MTSPEQDRKRREAEAAKISQACNDRERLIREFYSDPENHEIRDRAIARLRRSCGERIRQVLSPTVQAAAEVWARVQGRSPP